MTEVDTSGLASLANAIITQAKKMGAIAAETAISVNSGFAINVRKNQVETIHQAKEKGVSVTVYFNYRSGSASSSDLSQKGIDLMLEKACHIAKFTEEDPCVGLADKKLMAYQYPNLDLYHPWSINIQDAIQLAKESEACGMSQNKFITNSEGFSINTDDAFNIYANSHDFCGSVFTTQHSMNCTLVAEKNHEMQRDYYYTVARDPQDLEKPDQVAIKAAQKAAQRLGAKKIATQKCPVIFKADIASELVNDFVRAIYGANIYRKSSFLLDRINHQVFPHHINIEENPLLPKALGSYPYDDEGVKILQSDLVVDGILKRYILDSYSARKLNMQTTGNAGGIRNLIVKPGTLTFNDLLKKMGRGLLVTELNGESTNIVTGDYSCGVFGYWVENGQIQHPVNGVTIADNLKNVLLKIEEISTDVDHRHNILIGSILINEMIVGGN